jgi:hypothetical protein
MPITYNKIASATVGSGGAANIDFTSIPGTYTDLVVYLSARSSGSFTDQNISLRFNSSTTGYSRRVLSGNGSAASSSNSASEAEMFIGDVSGSTGTSNTFGNLMIYVPNYAGATNKSVSVDSIQENNTTAANARLIAGLWSDTAAITSLSVRLYGGGFDFVQHSTATLYGIKKD